jgi:hypothetical protein
LVDRLKIRAEIGLEIAVNFTCAECFLAVYKREQESLRCTWQG